MSDPISKVKHSIKIDLIFDDVLYKINPSKCVSYNFSLNAKSVSEIPIEELRAIEFSLKTIIDTVIKPEIAKRHKNRNIKPVTGL